MKLLSLLVCLAMMLSGGYMADDPNAAASTQITIRDLVVEIQGEEYPLNPTATFTASTENDAALLDFFMTLDDQNLFPVQAKVDDSGAGVLLGNSTTAYTFSPEFFDEVMEDSEIPEETFAMIDAYFALLRASMNLDPSDSGEINRAATEKLVELVGEVETTEATFTANGEEQTGQHWTFNMDSDAMVELMDYTYSLLPEDFTAAYYDYLNAMTALAGSSELTSVGDLMDYVGVNMSLSGEITSNETSAAGEIIIHTLIDETASYLNAGFTEEEIAEMELEHVALDIPIDIIVHSPGNLEYEMVLEQDVMNMTIASAVSDSAQTVSMTISVLEMMDMSFDLNIHPLEDASTQVSMNMSIDAGSSPITLTTDTISNDAGSITDVSFSSSYGSASFTVDVTHETISDRISEATPQMITSTEESEDTAYIGLSLAAMSMMGDAEKLLNDESVAALVPVVEQFFGYADMEADVVEETVEIADNTEAAEPTFTEPEFSWLPEGFELSDSYFDGEYDCYSFVYSATDDSGSEIYIDVYNEAEEDFYTYFIISDGAATPIHDHLITGYTIEDGGYATAYGTVNGYSVYVSIYGSDTLTIEDAANIVAGMTIAE